MLQQNNQQQQQSQQQQSQQQQSQQQQSQQKQSQHNHQHNHQQQQKQQIAKQKTLTMPTLRSMNSLFPTWEKGIADKQYTKQQRFFLNDFFTGEYSPLNANDQDYDQCLNNFIEKQNIKFVNKNQKSFQEAAEAIKKQNGFIFNKFFNKNKIDFAHLTNQFQNPDQITDFPKFFKDINDYLQHTINYLNLENKIFKASSISIKLVLFTDFTLLAVAILCNISSIAIPALFIFMAFAAIYYFGNDFLKSQTQQTLPKQIQDIQDLMNKIKPFQMQNNHGQSPFYAITQLKQKNAQLTTDIKTFINTFEQSTKNDQNFTQFQNLLPMCKNSYQQFYLTIQAIIDNIYTQIREDALNNKVEASQVKHDVSQKLQNILGNEFQNFNQIATLLQIDPVTIITKGIYDNIKQEEQKQAEKENQEKENQEKQNHHHHGHDHQHGGGCCSDKKNNHNNKQNNHNYQQSENFDFNSAEDFNTTKQNLNQAPYQNYNNNYQQQHQNLNQIQNKNQYHQESLLNMQNLPNNNQQKFQQQQNQIHTRTHHNHNHNQKQNNYDDDLESNCGNYRGGGA